MEGELITDAAEHHELFYLRDVLSNVFGLWLTTEAGEGVIRQKCYMDRVHTTE